MKHVTAVYNLRSHTSITVRGEHGERTYTVNMSDPAEMTLFKFFVRYLRKLTIGGIGFFGCTSGGWHWLRYTDLEATK